MKLIITNQDYQKKWNLNNHGLPNTKVNMVFITSPYVKTNHMTWPSDIESAKRLIFEVLNNGIVPEKFSGNTGFS